MYNLAVINLKTIKSNVKKIRAKLTKSTKLCAVVKADAYGHGIEQVSNAINMLVDYFAVSIIEEGISLRLSGIKKDILVLVPCKIGEIERAIDYNLTLTVNSILDVNSIIKVAKRLGAKVKVHFKYNTGMNRLGFDNLIDLNKALLVAKKSKVIVIDGIYSHYANPQNRRQLEKAKNKFLLANKLIKGYNENVICHISASGGFLADNNYFDMVRIGILLYGYKPFKSEKVNVKPAMKVYSPVIKNRTIKPFESALYGKKPNLIKTRISLIRFGYADGLFRKQVKGQFNNRCMDITAIKGEHKNNFKVLDNADILAKKYHTIPYEILTSFYKRTTKIYIR